MELLDSTKLSSFRKEYFEHAKQSELYKNIINTNGKIVFGRGSDNPRIVFIGEAPGQEENKQGKPFVGRSGKLLDKWIEELNLDNKDFAVVNVVPIIPLNSENGIRKPTDNEIQYFFPFTEKYLQLLNPEVIVLLGRSAASIFDKTLSLGQIKHWKETKLFFIYHPSYYLRKGGKGFETTLSKLNDFLQDRSTQKELSNF
jgi:uracil-DNA glycosylase